MWFSPDGEYLAFLRLNETGVPTYTVPYYINDRKPAPPYPRKLDIRYPKVSEHNPTVTFNLLNVKTIAKMVDIREVPNVAFSPSDLIIGEVFWATDKHDTVIYRAFNRVQDRENFVRVSVPSAQARTIRERNGSDGWLENSMMARYIGAGPSGVGDYYLDISDMKGWSHLYLFPVNGGTALQLTFGEWEVTEILWVDRVQKLVYYLSTEHHSTERHFYSVSYRTTVEKRALVNPRESGWWDASFSTYGGYYILTYGGPGIPWEKVYSAITHKEIRTLNNNAALTKALAEYKLPSTKYLEFIHPSGYSLNVKEVLPANFDSRKKYPVLFNPYGGPNSQSVQKTFSKISWSTYIGSDPELEYIIVVVDNRGTGYKGREFRSAVVGNLGQLEAEDQIWAAKLYTKEKPYVDEDHMAIWGWSYGGYLSGKVVERNSGAFSLAMLTAPVSDWRFYDSVYTERYMKVYKLLSSFPRIPHTDHHRRWSSTPRATTARESPTRTDSRASLAQCCCSTALATTMCTSRTLSCSRTTW